MARHPRFDLPGVPQHVVQRGNDRQCCFRDDADRERYLHHVGEALASSRCEMHAYVLMSNHVHLLVTPPGGGAIALMMQIIGRAYVAWFNLRHGRTGTLWEGRYKACLVDTDRYFLACSRYIDLNPVRAGLVPDPGRYAWSSCRHLLGLRTDPRVVEHAVFRDLHPTPCGRARAYRRLLDSATPAEELADIRSHLRQQKAWGSDAFRARVELATGRHAGVRPAHRPGRA